MGQESQDWSLELDSEGSDTPRSKESLGAHLANRLLSCPPGERRREEGTQRMSPVHAETRSTRNKRQQTASLSIASLLNSIIGEVGKTAANNAQLCLKLKDGNKVRLADALEALGDVCGDFEIRVPIHSLDVLPPELLGVCLSFLDLKAVLAAAQVCSLWGHLCNSLTIWRHLCRSTWPRYTEQAERAFQRRLKGIHQSPMVAVPSQAQVGGADSMWWKQAFFTKRNLESSWLEPREKRRFHDYTLLKQDLGIHCIQFDEHELMTGSGVGHEIGIWDMKKPHAQKGSLHGHILAVTCLHFDSEKVVSGSLDKTVRIWDRQSRKCSQVLTGHRDKVWCAQFSGDRLVSGSSDKTVRVWDLNTGEALCSLREHRTSVSCVRISGRNVVSGSAGNTIRVWDMGETPVCLAKLKGHQKGVFCLQFDHSKIISGSLDNTLRVWDPRDRYSLMHTIHADDSTHGSDSNKGIICFAYDDTKIISGGAENLAMVWDMRMWRRVDTLSGHSHWITSLQFDDHKLVTGSRDRCAKLWHFNGSHTEWP